MSFPHNKKYKNTFTIYFFDITNGVDLAKFWILRQGNYGENCDKKQKASITLFV